jgi:MFS family permease
MAFLDSAVLNVALPAMQNDLGVSAREVQWIYGAYALVLAALMLVGGALGDHFGRRRVFVEPSSRRGTDQPGSLLPERVGGGFG